MVVADNWAKRFLEQRISRLRKNNMDPSGKLIASLEYGLDNGKTDAEAARLVIAFNEYGRIAEMRNLQPHDNWGRNAMDRLEEWITRKGVEYFVAGFMEKRGLKNEPWNTKKMINEIAWGILVNRGKGKFKRKPWYTKPKSAALTDLYNEVAVRLLDKSADIITNQFKQ